MGMTGNSILTRDLVLVGGGHAHALALRMWAMAPVAGVQLTLINPGPTAPYSGMLPGHIAGHYTRDALDIDLVKLAQFAGARLIMGAAESVDPVAKTITVTGRGKIAYDVASLDVGLHAVTPHLAGLVEHGVGAKPLDTYADRWASFVAQVAAGQAQPDVAVIGGGVAGVELAMAMAHRLASVGAKGGVTVIEAEGQLAPIIPRADPVLRAAMARLGVNVETNAKVAEVTPEAVILSDGRQISAELTVATAGGFAHPWVAQSPLPCDADGFVKVDAQLRVLGCEGLFAVGDCAHLTASPRPKAGVFAVRAAPVLLHNLKAELAGGAPRSFLPQGDYLKLISLGGQEAMAAKWGRCLSKPAKRLWAIKDRIDQKFMAQFTHYPNMGASLSPDQGAVALGAEETAQQMLCGGCGAKVAPTELAKALAQMPQNRRADVLSGPGDDAAQLRFGDVTQVISVDHLRGFVADHGLVARIAAVHALGDIWAMGAAPQSALISVTLPRMSPDLQARAMAEIMAAAGDVVRHAGADIVGGHSTMGAELSIGLTVTGVLAQAAITVAGAQPGDALILTRPIGSGTILAASMQGKARGADVTALLERMAQPQGDAAELLRSAHAMTDVTGFGLAGHLRAICSASDVAAVLDLAAIPTYAGAEALAAEGHRSTIYDANRAHAPVAGGVGPKVALLHDPQTAGGLLAAVAPQAAEELRIKLRAAGHEAAVIGQLEAGPVGLRCL
ncbi:selenide, water dikinase SelD [Shimia sp. R11_0]|uniref:selenide, water dikinase SelD n=1 Tax=Shimia sp. R11_0 TaxID=2821096 RepID=UPI0032AF1B42